MKKIILIMMSAVLVFCFPFCVRAEDDINVSAESFVLYCPDNGELVLAENADKRMRPASTTKLMTTLITLEKAATDNKIVGFTEEMIAEGSSMYLKLGEKVTLKDLAAGMMMASGNDAANAAAISIAGGFKQFSRMMNKKAAEIGMKNTQFITPSGLDDADHFSTAYDMALLMAYALKNKDFKELTAQRSVTVDFIEPENKRITYTNHNRLLSMYEYCTGGKTGYTMAAGRCLVSSAKKDGLTLICVTMNDGNDWNDHMALYDYGFSRLSMFSSPDKGFCVDVPCVGGEADTVALMGAEDTEFVVNAEDKDKITRKIFIDSFLYAPIKADEEAGIIEYSLNGKKLKTVKLLTVG